MPPVMAPISRFAMSPVPRPPRWRRPRSCPGASRRPRDRGRRGSMVTLSSCMLPLTLTLTMPPPALASTVLGGELAPAWRPSAPASCAPASSFPACSCQPWALPFTPRRPQAARRRARAKTIIWNRTMCAHGYIKHSWAVPGRAAPLSGTRYSPSTGSKTTPGPNTSPSMPRLVERLGHMALAPARARPGTAPGAAAGGRGRGAGLGRGRGLGRGLGGVSGGRSSCS